MTAAELRDLMDRLRDVMPQEWARRGWNLADLTVGHYAEGPVYSVDLIGPQNVDHEVARFNGGKTAWKQPFISAGVHGTIYGSSPDALVGWVIETLERLGLRAAATPTADQTDTPRTT